MTKAKDFLFDAIATAAFQMVELDGLPDDLSDQLKDVSRTWRPWIRFEEELLEIMSIGLRKEAERLAEELMRNRGFLADGFWLLHQRTLEALLEPTLISLAEYGVSRVLQSLGAMEIVSMGVDWNLVNQGAVDFAKEHTINTAQIITETTQRRIGEEIADWMEAGEPLEKLKKRIRSLTDEGGQPVFNQVRADMIATTEATNVYAAAQAQTLARLGYGEAAFLPAAHVNCRCNINPGRTKEGQKVIVWRTAKDELVCTKPIAVPWGKGEVAGCRALHGIIISHGELLGQKLT